MDQLSVKEQSWHYRLAVVGGLPDHVVDTDICTYLRHIGNALFMSVVVIVCALAILVPVAATVGWLVACLQYATWIEPADLAAVGLISLTFAVILTIVFVTFDYLKSRKDRKVFEPKEMTFIGAAINSLKNKVCFRVKIVE